MAREEHPREDLLRDARNISPRVLVRLALPVDAEPVFCGFRGDAISFYFGEDPVYQFNPRGELRRAFVNGQLIKAEGGELIAMQRERTATSSTLASRDLSPQERVQLLDDMTARLSHFRHALAEGAYELEGEVPAGSNAIERVRGWLARHTEFVAANTPRVGV